MAEGNPSQIGRYKIVEEVGRGGFGRVYRGYDPTVGRPVAIKILSQVNHDVLTRFRNEAMVAGNLRHENIVTVYEYGTHEDLPFLAMEYLEGEDLHHIITSHKPLTLLEKCNIMSQVAEGLSCAHRNGVVHRDVKPANIMVLRDGTVKIMDFGIARLTRDSDATRLTQQGYLIGTLLYMAPEQFGGSDFDALCDIFAYGVIFYELITGKHPFEAPDPRSLMYKLSFEEPSPIREFIPEFPDSLQQVITKLIHKDRGMRYQSLKEVQFDAEPIRIDLQRERAATLLLQAQELFDKKQLDPAQTVLQEVLSLEPSNRVARSLWENLQKQLQQRSLKPRIESLLSSAEEHLAQRRFADAVQVLESALKLDHENLFIQGRMEESRRLLEHARKASQLLSEARRQFEQQNLTAASRTVSEALRHDPQCPEAAEFLKTIESGVERRLAEQRVDEAIRRAQGLLLIPAYDDAIALLSGLGSDSESPKIQRVLEWVRSEKIAHERKQKLRNEMARATDLLRDHKPDEGAKCLEDLQREFPENKEVANLLAYAQKELAALAREKAVRSVAGQAEAFVESHNFEDALAALDEGLKTYPGESALIRQLVSTTAAKAAWERQQAVQSTLAKCEMLRSQQRFSEAIETVEATLQVFSAEPALVSLLEQLDKQWTQQRRNESVRKVKEQAEKLLKQEQPDKALQLVQQTLVRYPGEPELVEILLLAQEQVHARQRARAVEAIGKDAARRVEAQDFEAALHILDQGLETWHDDAALLRQREEILAAKHARERQKAIGDIVARVQQLQAEENFPEAVNLLAASLLKFPGDDSLTRIQKQVDKAWEEHKRRQAVLRIASEARLLISRGRLDEAAAMLNEAIEEHPAEAELDRLAAQAQAALRARERAQAIERMLQESRELLVAKQFNRSREVVEQGLRSYEGERGLVLQLEAITQAEAAWRRAQAIESLLAQAAQLAEDERFDDALKLLVAANLQSPALIEARKRIEAQLQQHLRREAIGKAASEARDLLDRGRLEEAIQRLQKAATNYPEEREWEPLLERAQVELAARKHAEAVAKLVRDAQARAELHNFADALKIVAGGLANWPDESELLRLRQAIEADRSAWQREQAIQQIVTESEQLGRQRLYERALAQLSGSLEQYPEAAVLLDLRKRLEGEWELRKRADAISQAAEQARTMIAGGQLIEALSLLRELCATYPGEATFQSMLAEAEKTSIERERRNRAVLEAEALLQDGRFEEVVGSLEPFVASFPRDAELTSLIARATELLKLRRRQEAIEKVANEALALADRREFEGALTVMSRGLKSWPGEDRLLKTRESIISSKQAWQKTEALHAAIETARTLGREKRFAEALTVVEAALKDHRADATLLALGAEFRFRQDVARARRLIEEAQPTAALELLAKCSKENISDPEVNALIEKAHADELAAAIDKQAQQARARADAGDFEGALALLDEGLKKWPKATALHQIRQATLVQKAAQQRREAVQSAITQCEELGRQGQLEAAIECADRFLADFKSEPALLKVRERLGSELAEHERRAKRQRDLADLRELETAAIQASGPSEIAALLAAARGIVAQYPGDGEVQSVGSDPIRHLSDIERARNEVDKRNFNAALDICQGYLAQHADHVIFGELKREAERGQRLVYVAEIQGRAAAEPDLQQRAHILQEGLIRYPEESALSDELRFTRNKLGLADSIVEKARGCELAGNWAAALEQWNSLLTIYDRYPGLQAEIERVELARVKALSDSVEHWAQQIERSLKNADPGEAAELLRRAQSEHPEAARLQDLSRQVREYEEKRKRARELLAQAQGAKDRGNYVECQACLRQAFQMDEADAAFRKLVLNKLVEYARSAMQTDWRQAEMLLVETTSLQPGYAAPDAMLRTIADRKKEAAVADCVRKAEQHQKAGNVRSALAEVELALQSYPNEARIKKMRDALAARVHKEREALVAELRHMDQAAQAARQASEIEPIRIRASAIRAENQDDSELVGLAASLVGSLELRTKQLKRARLRSLVAANRNRLLLAAGAATAILAGVVIVPRMLRAPEEIAVHLTSDVAGASVAIGEKNCITPNCALSLPPGTYTLRAAKDGYKATTRQVTIASKQAALQLALALEPLPQLLQVNTNFESGEVFVDGRRAGDLRDGQYTAAGIAPGKHTIQVTGGGAEFRAEWQSAQGGPPERVELITAKDVQATVVANAGASGSIACNCDAQDIKVDGVPAGKTPASAGPPTALKDLKEGAHQIAVGSRSLVVDIRANPTLNIFLSLDRNVGMLTVETGEDKVRVFLNNRLYRRTTEHGMLRIPVDVGEYSVRVEKEGFQPLPPLTVTLKKGEEKPVRFALTRAPAYLEIGGAVAGAQVKVDGQALGETDRNGAFRREIAPGPHLIELTKDDYTPVRLSEQFTPGKTIQLARARVAMAKTAKVTSPPDPKPDPKQVEAQQWAQIASSTNPDDFDGFIRNHPGSTYAETARSRAGELRQQSQLNAARQNEQAAWDKVDSNRKEHLQDYLSRFPAGAHASEARAKIADLDRQAVDTLAAQRIRDQKEQEQAKRVADEQAVIAVLKDFETAYNLKDLPLLQKLWNGVPVTTYRNQFKDATDLKFQLQPAGQPSVSGNSATVTCTRTLSYKGKVGGPQTNTERVRVTLSREASGWLIRSIEGPR